MKCTFCSVLQCTTTLDLEFFHEMTAEGVSDEHRLKVKCFLFSVKRCFMFDVFKVSHLFVQSCLVPVMSEKHALVSRIVVYCCCLLYVSSVL